MRRLPIYFVLDVSESMVGEPLMQLEDGVNRIVSSLRKDPNALESVYISIIAFAGKAQVITPLIDLISYYPPKLPIGGGTALGLALDVLMDDIDTKVIKQSKDRQGDWEPLIFLITDGVPTDRPNFSIDRWKKEYSSRASIVAITLGDCADISILSQLSSNVLKYEGSSDEDFKHFVDWITASVKTQSVHVENTNTHKIQLAKTIKELIEISDKDNNPLPKSDTIVLLGRCQKSQRAYLIKYSQKFPLLSLRKYNLDEKYPLDGCYPISEEYFQWSAKDYKEESLSTNLLSGVASCPYCSNITTLALCGYCRKLMCLGGEGEASCPWCLEINNFVLGEGDFDLNRRQG